MNRSNTRCLWILICAILMAASSGGKCSAQTIPCEEDPAQQALKLMEDLLECENERLAANENAEELFDDIELAIELFIQDQIMWLCEFDPVCIAYWESQYDVMIAAAEAVRDAAIDQAWTDYFDCSNAAYAHYFDCIGSGGGKPGG